MPNSIMSVLVALVLVLGGARLSDALAQMGGHSDRGYQHSFGHAESWAKEFDDPARDAWQKPAEVLDALHLEPTARVADLGAGTGYFSAQIAKRIPESKLFALDIEPDMLRYLEERAHREHLHVLVPVLGVPKRPIFPRRSMSFWSWTPITTLITGLRTLLS